MTGTEGPRGGRGGGASALVYGAAFALVIGAALALVLGLARGGLRPVLVSLVASFGALVLLVTGVVRSAPRSSRSA